MRETSVHRAFTRQQSNASGKAPTGGRISSLRMITPAAARGIVKRINGAKRQAGLRNTGCQHDGDTLSCTSRHLRRVPAPSTAPARLTKRELGEAVGYSEAHIARLKSNQRMPDPAVVCTQFVKALHLQDDPEAASQLIRLAEAARQMRFGPTCCAASTPDLSGGRGKSPR